jgi:hypothetical protein
MDQNYEIAKLQKEIQLKLGLGQENVIFEFKDKEQITVLNLVTINPVHEQSFLFHSTRGVSKIDALEKMLDYVSSTKSDKSSFTIQWVKKGNDELQTSYFRAKDMYEVLDKFSFGRDLNSYVIYSIMLNPMS